MRKYKKRKEFEELFLATEKELKKFMEEYQIKEEEIKKEW